MDVVKTASMENMIDAAIIEEVRLEMEWGADPVWVMLTEGGLRNDCGESLGLTFELRRGLKVWMLEYLKRFDLSDPVSTYIPESLYRQGWALAECLKREVGPEIRVVACDPVTELRTEVF